MSVQQTLPDNHRLHELLCDRALDGLDASESAEVAELIGAGDAEDATAYDEVVAMLGVAMLERESHVTPMPTSLRSSVRSAVITQARGASTGETTARESHARPAPTTTSTKPASAWQDDHRARWSLFGTLGWVAAAACLAIAFVAWRGETTPPPAQQRQALLQNADQLVRANWQPLDSEYVVAKDKAASGDVIWSPQRQEGYMRLAGLKVNDPSQEQYQLWIFRGDPDTGEALEAHPVDGGVFNVTSTGEVVVPINAKLDVGEPTAFAITVEKPGGVVVSSRERLPLLAQPSA